MTDFAFVAGAKLYVRLGADDAREIESPFARNVVERSNKKERHGDLMRSVVAGNLMRAADENDGEPPELPSSWQLVARAPDGKVRVVARGVSCFDVAADGTVIYADSRAIHRVGAGGERETIVKQRDVRSVCVLADAK